MNELFVSQSSSDRVSLEESYAWCKALHKLHGTTYYYATMLLPRIKRHHVHALYGFVRHADEILDRLDDTPMEVRTKELHAFEDQFFDELSVGSSNHPVLKAVIHTVKAFDMDPEWFKLFLRSMEMDLTVETYATWDDLLVYMGGSAAVIGDMMLPILEPLSVEATEPARALGNAFQLTNFIRDIGEDLQRNRVYLPQDDIVRFGAADALRSHTVTRELRELLAFEIDRARSLYVDAAPGLEMLPPSSRPAIEAAFVLYRDILHEVEKNDYDVFSSRAHVATWKKLAAASRLGLDRVPFAKVSPRMAQLIAAHTASRKTNGKPI